MDWIEALILGVIQGLTEFLPVSSSGHLELTKAILGDTSMAEESMLMTVVLHFATALSTIVVFRKDIADILRGLLQFRWNEDMRFSLKIIISMIPAALVGLLLKDEIESLFTQNVLLVSSMLILTAFLLWFADRTHNNSKPVSNLSALLIGIAQAIAIMPGISRSGATISTALLLKVDRVKATRFSFLMVVPLILGAMAKDLIADPLVFDKHMLMPLGVGFTAAFITGIAACTWMISLVKKAKLSWFALYCLVVGVGAILYTLLS